MNYRNEYEFLIKNIESGKGPEQLSQEARDYGLDGNQVLMIIQGLIDNQLVTTPNSPNLYGTGSVTTRLMSRDWDKVIRHLTDLESSK